MRFAWPPVNRLSSQICAPPAEARSGTVIEVAKAPLLSVGIPVSRVTVPAESPKAIVTESDGGQPAPLTETEESREPELGETESEPAVRASIAVLLE